MAAAEYFNPGSTTQNVPGPPPGPPPAFATGPTPQQQPPNQSQTYLQPPNQLPYPLSDAPPPYSSYTGDQQRPHSQPPPQQRVSQQQGYNNQPQYQAYQPNQSNGRLNVDTHQYPPDKMPQRPSSLNNMSRPSDYTSSHPPTFPPQQQNGYPAPQAVAPGLSQVYNNNNSQQKPQPQRRSSTSGYPTEQSPYRRSSRSRSRERRQHHHQHNNNNPPRRQDGRPGSSRQKSSGVNTFLGAGSGALIGDLIFPGLGTLGGAILGGVGGHEYSKKRTQSNPSRGGPRRSYSGAGGEAQYSEEDYRRGRKY